MSDWNEKPVFDAELSRKTEDGIKAEKRLQIEENVSRAKLQQIRIDSFLAKIELRKRQPECTLAESEALDELKNNADFRPDEELVQLPCFSQYVIDCIEKRELELKVNIKASGIYIAYLTDLDRLQVEMMNISKQSGLYKAESEEFKELIHHWWLLHRVIHSQRLAWLFRFQVPMPPAKTLIPDRLYLGVLLNEEDYVFFLAKNMMYSRGMVVQKGENEDEYSNELSKKAFGESTPMPDLEKLKVSASSSRDNRPAPSEEEAVLGSDSFAASDF